MSLFASDEGEAGGRPGPPDDPDPGSAHRMAYVLMGVVVVVFVATLLIGWRDWRGVVITIVAVQVVAHSWAAVVSRRPESHRYREEYRRWRQAELDRGESRWRLDFESIGDAFKPEAEKQREKWRRSSWPRRGWMLVGTATLAYMVVRVWIALLQGDL